MHVRDLLSGEVYARGDGTHTLQQSTTVKADHDACLRLDGLVQHPGCFVDTAGQRARIAEHANRR